MPTPRQSVAAQLRADLTTWEVVDWPWEPSELRKPTAVVYRTEMAPATGGLQHDLEMQVYGLKSIGPESEDELDNLLDAVMLSLQRLDGVAVKSAKRKTFGVFQGWELDLSWHSSDIYKAQV